MDICTWTIVFWSKVMKQQDSILCYCQFLDVFMGGLSLYSTFCLFVCSVVLNYYHKSCTNPNVLCFCPTKRVTLHCIRPCMHACKCTYASCAMHIYVYILLYLWNVVLIQIYLSNSITFTFKCMHLADAFIQSDLVHSGYIFFISMSMCWTK